MDRGLIDTVRQLLRLRLIPIVLVTVLTLGIVAAVLLTSTSAGCGLGVKSTRCANSVAAALHPSGQSAVTAAPTSVPNNPPPYNPGSSNNPPYNPGASSYPPYNPGASSYPPYNPGASAGSPIAGPASGSYPPMAYPSSGSSAPGLGLSCRLPVVSGGPGSGGFIVFPGGAFVADPRSAVTVPSPSPGTATPAPGPGPGPGYSGWYGGTYDAAYSKWLPVGSRWVSPDGAHYAYPLNGDVYVQSVAGGAQLVLGKGQNFTVLDLDNSGVYVEPSNQPGLWYLAFSGTTKQLSSANFWEGVSHGYAYGTITSAVPQGATDTILRLDIQSGATVNFFTQPGGISYLTGFDLQGHPTIQVQYNQATALFIATGPDSSTIIAASYGYSPFPYGAPNADSHGLWYPLAGGIVLFTNGAWYWMSNLGGQLAGQCV